MHFNIYLFYLNLNDFKKSTHRESGAASETPHVYRNHTTDLGWSWPAAA